MSQIREKIVHFGSRRSALVRSRSTYVAVLPAWIGFGGVWAQFWVAAVDCGEISVYVCGDPPPEINVEGFNIFFRLSARSSNTHQRGFIWSAILTTLNFREKTRLQSGDTLF